MKSFKTKCVDGITAYEDVMTNCFNQSVGMVTALNPVLGYQKTTKLAKETLEAGKGIIEPIREKKLLTEDRIKELLDPKKMTEQ